MGEKVFHATDEDKIIGTLDDGADVADGAGDADLGVAADGRGGGDRR